MAPKDKETGNVINLSQRRGGTTAAGGTPRHVRKQQERAEKAEKAAANRARTGRTKAQKAQDRQAAGKTMKTVEDARLTGPTRET